MVLWMLELDAWVCVYIQDASSRVMQCSSDAAFTSGATAVHASHYHQCSLAHSRTFRLELPRLARAPIIFRVALTFPKNTSRPRASLHSHFAFFEPVSEFALTNTKALLHFITRKRSQSLATGVIRVLRPHFTTPQPEATHRL